MSLKTFSQFLYGFRVQANVNDTLDFDEGGGEIQATITPGGYSMQQLAIAIETSLNALGANTYIVSADIANRRFTITADGGFDLLASTGSRVGTGIWQTIGFSAANKTGFLTYSSDLPAGTVYNPQFILQSYAEDIDNLEAIDASVNESANGSIEVIRFGTRSFIEANIRFATDIQQPCTGPIENNPTGLQDLRDFLNYAILKVNFDFSKNRNVPLDSDILLLESTPGNKAGTGFQLEELFARGAPGYYETGVLKFRKVNL